MMDRQMDEQQLWEIGEDIINKDTLPVLHTFSSLTFVAWPLYFPALSLSPGERSQADSSLFYHNICVTDSVSGLHPKKKHILSNKFGLKCLNNALRGVI